MDFHFDPRLLLALASGIVIAATCGLRAFLPLLALGVAGRVNLMPLAPSLHWLSSDLALIALGVATVAEVMGASFLTLSNMLTE